MGIADSSECARCGNSRDTLEHRYWHCPSIHKFWDEIKAWLSRNKIINDEHEFTEPSVLFGTSNNALINHVIINVKEMIKRGTGLQLSHLVERLQKDKETEKYIAKINGTSDRYQKKWAVFTDDSLI